MDQQLQRFETVSSKPQRGLGAFYFARVHLVSLGVELG